MPKLSIITVNLNNKAGLQKTIDSVISQTYKDFEWIIIDGGSTDGSKELIEKYSFYITYWVSEPDKGIYNAMNKGIRVAKGEYLHFLNSGDWYYDDNVLRDVFSIKHTGAVLYGNIAGYKNNAYVSDTIYPMDLSLYFFYKERICHQAAFILRSTFDKMLYDETKMICADYKHFVALIIKDKYFEYLDRLVVCVDRDGISGNAANYPQMIKERLGIWSEIIPATVLKDYSNYNRVELQLQNELVSLALKIFETNRYFRFVLKCFMRMLLFISR